MVEIHIIKELKLITNKPECIYGLTVCKCPISSQTIKYRYKFKSNQKQVKPLSVSTSSSQTKKKRKIVHQKKLECTYERVYQVSRL